MHLVIDGYNLIHQVPEFSRARAMGRGVTALLTALHLYRKKKRHRITVVLDGGPDAQSSSASQQGIPIIYSGGEKSADDVIAGLSAKHGPGITVITDDRELAGRCKNKGSETIPSWEFAGLLVSTAQGQGFNATDERDRGWDFTTKKKGPSRRLPKAKRKLAKRKKQL